MNSYLLSLAPTKSGELDIPQIDSIHLNELLDNVINILSSKESSSIVMGTSQSDQIQVFSTGIGVGLDGNDSLSSIPLIGFGKQIFALYGGIGNDMYRSGLMSSSGTFVPDILTLVFDNNHGYDTVSLSSYLDTTIETRSTNYRVLDGKHLYIQSSSQRILIADAFDTSCGIDWFTFKDKDISFQELWDNVSAGAYDNATVGERLSLGTVSDVIGNSLFNVLNELKFTTPFGGNNTAPAVQGSSIDQLFTAFFDESQYLTNKTNSWNATSETKISEVEMQNLITTAGMSLWDHFKLYGAFEKNDLGKMGINPSMRFDLDTYYTEKTQMLSKNGDVFLKEDVAAIFQQADIDPLTHFSLYGQSEGMHIISLFGVETPIL